MSLEATSSSFKCVTSYSNSQRVLSLRFRYSVRPAGGARARGYCTLACLVVGCCWASRYRTLLNVALRFWVLPAGVPPAALVAIVLVPGARGRARRPGRYDTLFFAIASSSRAKETTTTANCLQPE